MKPVVVKTKVKQYTEKERIYYKPTDTTYNNSDYVLVERECLVCTGILIDISINSEKTKYIVVSKNKMTIWNFGNDDFCLL